MAETTQYIAPGARWSQKPWRARDTTLAGGFAANRGCRRCERALLSPFGAFVQADGGSGEKRREEQKGKRRLGLPVGKVATSVLARLRRRSATQQSQRPGADPRQYTLTPQPRSWHPGLLGRCVASRWAPSLSGLACVSAPLEGTEERPWRRSAASFTRNEIDCADTGSTGCHGCFPEEPHPSRRPNSFCAVALAQKAPTHDSKPPPGERAASDYCM